MSRLQPTIDRWQAWADANDVTFKDEWPRRNTFAASLDSNQLTTDHQLLEGILTGTTSANDEERDQVTNNRTLLTALRFSMEAELAARARLDQEYVQRFGPFRPETTETTEIDLSQRGSLERAINGALRDQLNSHGPITKGWTSSAAKRVIGAIKTWNRNNRSKTKADTDKKKSRSKQIPGPAGPDQPKTEQAEDSP